MSSSEIEMIAQSSRDRMMMDWAKKKLQRMFCAKSVENHIYVLLHICQNLEFGTLFYLGYFTFWSIDNLVDMVHWYLGPGVKTFYVQKTFLSKSRHTDSRVLWKKNLSKGNIYVKKIYTEILCTLGKAFLPHWHFHIFF